LKWQAVPHPVEDNKDGPTYNPIDHPVASIAPFSPREIGFRDPVTVVVKHEFALLPGIGRILGTPIDPKNAMKKPEFPTDDKVAMRISRQSGSIGPELYTVPLEASATFVNEGFKSVIRYAVQP
jgi:hypothetical protein